MRMLVPAMAVLSLMASGPLLAQERTAGGTMETQMTWSALTDQINALKTRVDGANARVDQVVVCGKKTMFYAPGATGADSQGCLGIAAAPTPPAPPVTMKTETKTFTEKLAGYIPGNYKMPNPNDYCIGKGYDTSYASALNKVTSSHHCGGSSGGMCDYTNITGYTISCIRSVPAK